MTCYVAEGGILLYVGGFVEVGGYVAEVYAVACCEVDETVALVCLGDEILGEEGFVLSGVLATALL